MPCHNCRCRSCRTPLKLPQPWQTAGTNGHNVPDILFVPPGVEFKCFESFDSGGVVTKSPVHGRCLHRF